MSQPAPGKPAARKGDAVVGLDIHVLMIPSPAGPIPTPTPLPFTGVLADALSADVKVENKPVALVGSVANNTPAHVPAGGPFQKPPANKATIKTGSGSVFANNKKVAVLGSIAETCADPMDGPNGSVIGTATTVLVGGA